MVFPCDCAVFLVICGMSGSADAVGDIARGQMMLGRRRIPWVRDRRRRVACSRDWTARVRGAAPAYSAACYAITDRRVDHLDA